MRAPKICACHPSGGLIKPFAAVVATLLGLSVAAPRPAFSGEAAAGPVVLTVAGNIANANRPAYRDKLDVIFRYHKRAFDRAFAFDRAMLEGRVRSRFESSTRAGVAP